MARAGTDAEASCSCPVFLAVIWNSAAAKKTGQEQEASASVPARAITFDRGDETVGVDETDDQ